MKRPIRSRAAAAGRRGGAATERRLFFLSLDSRMMAVSVDPAKGTTVGVPRELFRTELRRGYQNRPYDVTRDGQRFLVPTIRPSDDFRVVLNWRALLPS